MDRAPVLFVSHGAPTVALAQDGYALALREVGPRWPAPAAVAAAPTSERFAPSFVALGAAPPGERVATVYEGFHYRTLGMRSFALLPGGETKEQRP
ncbi:hypothetical protein [Anaeromyxobacter paludicola]|uniref:Extradiol ring-cleavage dioxygenase class III enzyme subunit B domain-containing protein n=1 Tax=Anaeromyxobacter paludicola TaxID=2918171 RepID=A0ABN6NAJ6_9BACT|nr:hypothetical protein [Anaeromyxobacter paludicola]BDG10256.1 hypothetical protein AMPC_33690 [Anaeromyxobacter paludicola]